MKQQITYTEPVSIEQAQGMRLDLVRVISDITGQLGNKNKKDPNGNRIPSKEYFEWRTAAVKALRAHEDVLRRLNAWIEKNQKTVNGSCDEIIVKAYKLLRTLEEDEIDLDSEELQIIEELGKYVNSKKGQQPPEN